MSVFVAIYVEKESEKPLTAALKKGRLLVSLSSFVVLNEMFDVVCMRAKAYYR